jgi:hypothetical protein
LQTLIIGLAFLSSCQKDKVIDLHGAEEIVIDARTREELPIDAFFEKIDYIKLETTESNLIGQPFQIVFTDSLIIVSDRDNANSAFVFDMQGKFRYQLGRRGNGPGEYVEVSRITLVPGKEQIVMEDCPQKKIHYFNYSGEYITSETFPFMLFNFEYLPSGYRAFNVSAMHDPTVGELQDSTLIVTDNNYNIVYGACHDFYKANHFMVDKNKSMWQYGDTVYYSPGFSNMIYTVSDSMVHPRYYINLWNNIPAVDENTTGEKFKSDKSHFFFNGDFVELKDYTYINIFTPHGLPFIVYSHAKKQTFFGGGYSEHPLGVFLQNNAPMARYKENCVVLPVDASTIERYKKEFYKLEAYKELLDDLYEGLDEDSNPVLFFYHLKKDI